MSLSVDPRIGSELFGYRLEALLGRGGMGVVYKAYDPRLKRYVALKLIAPELSEDERFRERFLAESELAASMEHPNVVPIYDAFDADGRLAIAMRYVEGTDLKQLLQTERVLDPERAVTICAQVAAALDAAHQRGLVHRDVKPSNVLLDENEHVYLADFGLSRRLADPGVPGGGSFSVGTPAYAAPEQIEGGAVDGRADVYSLGCLLYECLTGEAPFKRDSELAVLWAHVQEEPPVLPGLEEVIPTALAKDPDERYATCGELVVAAREALGLHRPVTIRDRKALILTAVGVALAAAAVIAGVLLSQGGGPGKPSTKPTLDAQGRLAAADRPEDEQARRDDRWRRVEPDRDRRRRRERVGREPGRRNRLPGRPEDERGPKRHQHGRAARDRDSRRQRAGREPVRLVDLDRPGEHEHRHVPSTGFSGTAPLRWARGHSGAYRRAVSTGSTTAVRSSRRLRCRPRPVRPRRG